MCVYMYICVAFYFFDFFLSPSLPPPPSLPPLFPSLLPSPSQAHNELARLALTDLDVFVGIEQKRIDVRNPLPTRYPFCLLVRFEEQNKFLCADSADDRLLIISAVIFAKVGVVMSVAF